MRILFFITCIITLGGLFPMGVQAKDIEISASVLESITYYSRPQLTIETNAPMRNPIKSTVMIDGTEYQAITINL